MRYHCCRCPRCHSCLCPQAVDKLCTNQGRHGTGPMRKTDHVHAVSLSEPLPRLEVEQHSFAGSWRGVHIDTGVGPAEAADLVWREDKIGEPQARLCHRLPLRPDYQWWAGCHILLLLPGRLWWAGCHILLLLPDLLWWAGWRWGGHLYSGGRPSKPAIQKIKTVTVNRLELLSFTKAFISLLKLVS